MGTAGEAESRARRQWAVRKPGQRPGNLSPVYGVLQKAPRDVSDPRHPSAFAMLESWFFHIYWVPHTRTMAINPDELRA